MITRSICALTAVFFSLPAVEAARQSRHLAIQFLPMRRNS